MRYKIYLVVAGGLTKPKWFSDNGYDSIEKLEEEFIKKLNQLRGKFSAYRQTQQYCIQEYSSSYTAKIVKLIDL